MAKLSSRGRTENFRLVTKETNPEKLRDSDGELRILERSTTYAFMSDGHILKKDGVVFPAGPYDHGKNRRHDWGFKLWKRIKQDGRDIRTAQENVDNILKNAAERNGTLVVR